MGRTFVTLILSLGLLAQSATAQVSPDCSLLSSDWEGLVNEFVTHWTPEPDYCEFRRFQAIDKIFRTDMTAKDPQHVNYERHQAMLRGQDSAAIMALRLGLEETWFTHCKESAMNADLQETSSTKSRIGAAIVGLVGLAVALAYVKHHSLVSVRQYSAKSIRFLEVLFDDAITKRPVIFGSSSALRQKSNLEDAGAAADPQICVRPPIAGPETDAVPDPRVAGVFYQQFMNNFAVAGVAVGSGWAAGHYGSLSSKQVVRPWSEIFPKIPLLQNRYAAVANMDMLIGLGLSVLASEITGDEVKKAEFATDYLRDKQQIEKLTQQILDSVKSKNDFSVWLLSRKLENQILVNNDVYLRSFRQNLIDEGDTSAQDLIHKFEACDQSREQALRSEKVRFIKNVSALVNKAQYGIEAALRLSEIAERQLIQQNHEAINPLVDTIDNFIRYNTWLLNASELSENLWNDVVQTVSSQPIQCVEFSPMLGP